MLAVLCSVPQRAFCLACITGFICGGYALKSTAVSEGCGPECLGTCFAGACLFLDRNLALDLATEDLLRAPGASRGEDPLVQLLQLTQVEPSAFAQAPTRLQSALRTAVSHSIPPSSNFPSSSRMSMQPTWLAQSEVLAMPPQPVLNQVPLAVATSFVEALPVQNMTALPSNVGKASNTSSIGNASNASNATHGVAFGSARRAVTSLVTSLLEVVHQAVEKIPALSEAGKGAFWSAWQWAVAVIVVVLLLAVLWRACFTTKASTPPTSREGSVFDGALRYFGAAGYKLELSEVHFGSLLAGREVFVRCRLRAQDLRTSSVRAPEGCFLRFQEVLVLDDVRKFDGPCVLSAVDAQGAELARLELSARQLIDLSHRRHRQFFRSEMQADREMLQKLGNVPGRRPYMAMKITDITGGNAAPTATGSTGVHTAAPVA